MSIHHGQIWLALYRKSVASTDGRYQNLLFDMTGSAFEDGPLFSKYFEVTLVVLSLFYKARAYKHPATSETVPAALLHPGAMDIKHPYSSAS